MENSIFLSIASYRDPELIETVKSAIMKAKNPGSLTIGIYWQYDEDEDLSALDSLFNLKMIKKHWSQVEGSVCWARAEIQRLLFDDEDWYFQVDSHTRFAQDWDAKLIEMYSQVEGDAVISVGPPYYYDMNAEGGLPYTVNIDCDICYDNKPQLQKLDHAGTYHFMYGFIPMGEVDGPVRGRHISAALLFAPGKWVRDVPYDDKIYFHGEEPTLTVRTYTNGYDIYAPNQLVCWHLKYSFPDRKRHWNTFEREQVDPLSVASNERYWEVMNGELEGPYGLGNKRSMKDWEIYSGVSFVDTIGHPRAYKGYIPNPITIDDWDEWVEYKQKKEE